MNEVKAYITIANFVKFKKALVARKMKLGECIKNYECKLLVAFDLQQLLAVSFTCNDNVKALFNEYKIYI
jgi:hypothetical protein